MNNTILLYLRFNSFLLISVFILIVYGIAIARIERSGIKENQEIIIENDSVRKFQDKQKIELLKKIYELRKNANG